MEKRAEGELHQNQKIKSFNAKLWICLIGIALSIATVAVVCLGVALFASNGKVATLRTDLNGANEKIESLQSEKQTAFSKIDSLQSSLALTNGALDRLTKDHETVSNALNQSKTEQDSLVERINALEKAKKEALDQINQLKTDAENAKNEINQLKTDAEHAKSEIEDLKEQQKEPEDKIRIYIDQGHNPAPYHNTGASGNGLHEQDITFLIGCVLADLLKTDGRFEIELSRPNRSVVLGTDNNTSLEARVKGATDFNADYFISLHTNSFTADTANGIEVYVMEEGSESYAFGELLLNGMVESTNLRNRGMKTDDELYVLRNATMPAVLLEMGFISNSGDAAVLDEHPELFATGIYNGILEYFGLLPKNLG